MLLCVLAITQSCTEVSQRVFSTILFLHPIQLHLQIINDKLLPVRGVFSHIKRKQFLDAHGFVEHYGIQTDVVPYKMLKLIRRDFPQTFKAGDLWFWL